MNFQPDLGSLLDEFIKEFDCDASLRDDLHSLLITTLPGLDTDPDQIINKFAQKMSKKRPGVVAEFSSITKKIRSRDLVRANEIIAFLILHATKQSVLRKEQRKAKLALLNGTPKQSAVCTPVSTSNLSFKSSRFSLATTSSVNGVRFIDTKVKRTPILNGRAKTPTVVNTDDLIAGLLSALVGIEGQYIKVNAEGAVTVASSCSIDDALHSQFVNIFSIATYYVQLQRVTQRNTSDLVKQAFYSYIPSLLTEYSAVISNLYAKFSQCHSEVTALEISLALNYWPILMKQFVSLTKKCINWSGIETINATYALYCGSGSESLAKRLFEHALKSMLMIFHKNLRQWLLYGSLLKDSEWMIAVEGPCSSKNAWTTRYKIDNNAVPDIFKSLNKLTKKILMIGRSVGLLQSLDVEDRFSSERKRLIDSLDSLDFYLNIEDAKKFSLIINRMYNKMNAEVMREIVGNYHIRDHLEVVQKHFFLTDEGFAHAFFRRIDEISEHDMANIDSQIACEALSDAVSMCSTFPPHLYGRGHLEATCGITEKCGQILPSPRDDKGYPSVRLRYITQVPVSILLSENAMCRYNRIFDFIWEVIGVDFCLTDTMEHHRFLWNETVSEQPELLALYRLFSAVFVRMDYFVSILRNYINTVVDQCTKKFAAQFDDSSYGDLVKMVESHRHYLSLIEDQLFFLDESKTIRTVIMASLDPIKNTIATFKTCEAEFMHATKCRVALSVDENSVKNSSSEETKMFEIEERRINLKGMEESLLNNYRPLMKNTYASFELLVKDIVDALSALDKAPHYLLLQYLRFGNFC